MPLGDLRALRSINDPASSAVGTQHVPVDPSHTPEGHIFSPAIRNEQKDLASKFVETQLCVTEAKNEYDRLYVEGFERRGASDIDGAMECFMAAYVLAREMRYHVGEADALNMTGVCYKERDDPIRAIEVFEGCSELCASLNDTQAQAAALGNLGQALTGCQDLAGAEIAHTRSLCLARSASDANGELAALFHIGTLMLRQQRFTQAEAILAQAEAVAVDLRDVAAEVGVLQRLAAARGARLASGQSGPALAVADANSASASTGSSGCSQAGCAQPVCSQPNSLRFPCGLSSPPSVSLPPPLSSSAGLSDASRNGGGHGSTSVACSSGDGDDDRSSGRVDSGGRGNSVVTRHLDARIGTSSGMPGRQATSLDERGLSLAPPCRRFLRHQAFSILHSTRSTSATLTLDPLQVVPHETHEPRPLALLVRAERLTRDLEATSGLSCVDARPLRLQVLRQLRAQYLFVGDQAAASACEGEIDAIFRLSNLAT